MSNPSPAEPLNTVRLDIPCSSEFVTIARKAVEGVCSRLALTRPEISEITLAVGEACTNAVKFSGPECQTVELTFIISPQNLEVTVRNHGSPFGIEKGGTRMPPLEDLSEGGMGLYLISQVMDELSVTSKDGVTTLRMVKKLGE